MTREAMKSEIEIVVVDDPPIAFAAWKRVYDLHHCVAGADVIDMFVLADLAGRAPREIAAALPDRAWNLEP